jgi:hypothetical protein
MSLSDNVIANPITAFSNLSYELIPVMGVAILFPITLIKQRLLRLSPRMYSKQSGVSKGERLAKTPAMAFSDRLIPVRP